MLVYVLSSSGSTFGSSSRCCLVDMTVKNCVFWCMNTNEHTETFSSTGSQKNRPVYTHWKGQGISFEYTALRAPEESVLLGVARDPDKTAREEDELLGEPLRAMKNSMFIRGATSALGTQTSRCCHWVTTLHHLIFLPFMRKSTNIRCV